MNSIKYAADGVSAEFNFTHKWFRPADIRAFVNGVETECAVVPAAAAPEYPTPEIAAANDLGIAAHFGGRVIFATPPIAGASVVIRRRVSIDERLVAVSRTAAVRPNDFNLFAEWMTEYLKDLSSDIANIDALPMLAESVANARELLTNTRALLGDASNLATTADLAAATASLATIAQLTAAVATLTTRLDNDPGRIIASANNLSGTNYTNGWYKKYKNGLVEQGFITANSGTATGGLVITLPIAMANANYTFSITSRTGDAGANVNTAMVGATRSATQISVMNKNQTGIIFGANNAVFIAGPAA
ncbi:MAG: hypothetical protein LBL46_05125 [Rickettsiales bacterium]|jgi:hypothetical protein|nr:hypothetical protein [Rickettsiales bacterium]